MAPTVIFLFLGLAAMQGVLLAIALRTGRAIGRGVLSPAVQRALH